jgi:hypothetical protein
MARAGAPRLRLRQVGAFGSRVVQVRVRHRFEPVANSLNSKFARGHSSAGRAPALQAGGRRFDPGWLHKYLQMRPF